MQPYWQNELLESEANAFAGELLVPTYWISQFFKTTEDLAIIHKEISKVCNVSLHAAAIRLAQISPKNIIYAVERSGSVEFSGRTNGTLANSMNRGVAFNSDAYNYSKSHFHIELGDRTCHWWILPNTFPVNNSDNRQWRDTLNSILDDLDIPADRAPKLKSSINAVVAYANSVAKRSPDYSVDTVIAACIQRFKDRDEFKDFTEHPDFEVFVAKKAQSLAEI